MQSISAKLHVAFAMAIREAFGFDADPVVAPAQNDKFGDYQCNAAMQLAKEVSTRTGQKTSPRGVAERIVSHVTPLLTETAAEITIAGPGFINVRLNPAWLAARVAAVVTDKRLGVTAAGKPQTIVVDYSGPNIAKELHVGHLRSTIIGDALVRILGFQGHDVIRQNHLGDWGTQFGMLIANLRDQSSSEHQTELKDLEAFYVSAKKRFDADPEFQERARQTVVKLQSGDAATLTAWRSLVEKTREHYLPLYRRLGVLLTPDDERGESFYNDRLQAVLADLRQAGIAEESEGATVIFTDGKDKAPLIIQKSGGGYLYGTTDLAALRYRATELHANRIIYLVDARQSHHFWQVFTAARLAGWVPNVSLEHAAFGTMLGDEGKPFRSRDGGVVKLAALLDEAVERAMAVVNEKSPEMPESQRMQIAHAVGIGALKYADLAKDRVSDYIFSFDKMLALDGNTAPYLQYAHARIRSIFRRAAERDIKLDPSVTIELQSAHELQLAKHLFRLGETIDLVGRELKPHHLTSYLYEVATRFSGFFENCPVIQSQEPTRSSRLMLCDLTARTMALGLSLLGIEHPEQM